LIDGVAPKRFAGDEHMSSILDKCAIRVSSQSYYGMTVDYLWIVRINGYSK
jgi:hypothetical protein